MAALCNRTPVKKGHLDFCGNGQVSFLTAGICHTMYCVINPKGECQVGTKKTRSNAYNSARHSSDAQGDADADAEKGNADANAHANAHAEKRNAHADAHATSYAEKGNAHS